MDRDYQIRLAAMQQLEQLRRKGSGLVRADQLDEGFLFEGERIPLWNARRGIWRPRQLNELGAALTIVTAPRVQGRKPAYDDEVAADDRGTFGYRYEGTDPTTRRLNRHRRRRLSHGGLARSRRWSRGNLGKVPV